MKVALVGPEAEENLSLRYLAAALEGGGYEGEIVPFALPRDVPRVVRTLLRAKPDLVGLSLVHQKRVNEFYELVRRLRQAGYRGHVTAGGHFASLRAFEVMRDASGIDSVLHHEGERRLVSLASLLAVGQPLPGDVDGITWRDHAGHTAHRPARFVAALDTLDPPVRRAPNLEMGIPKAPLVSSRGCAGSCSFCSIHAWHRQVRGARLRLRDPESVAGEMAALHRDLGVRIFVFHDDDFIHPRADKALARCRAMLDRAAELIGEPFSFVIKCRPDDVDEELFAYLHERGLDRAYVGIESHATAGLRTLNRRVTQDQNLRALDILQRLGIYSCFNLLIWDPETTLDAFDENLAFLRTQADRPFDIARTELYAGATLEQRLISEGRVLGDYRGWDYRIGDARAERVFRLFVDSMWDRHFGRRPVTQCVQDLGYRLALLRRFHPETVTPGLDRRFAGLVRSVNAETVDCLQVIRDHVMATEARPGRRADVRFAKALRGRLRRSLWVHRYRIAALAGETGAKARLARAGRLPIPGLPAVTRALERVAASVPVAGLSLLLSSCGGNGDNDGEVICDPPPPPVTWDALAGRLRAGCGTFDCHGSAAGGLGLVGSPAQVYGNLVDVPSQQLPSMDLVEPGQPSQSYLYRKMVGTHLEAGGAGEAMPPPGAPQTVSSADVQEWIQEGAPATKPAASDPED